MNKKPHKYVKYIPSPARLGLDKTPKHKEMVQVLCLQIPGTQLLSQSLPSEHTDPQLQVPVLDRSLLCSHNINGQKAVLPPTQIVRKSAIPCCHYTQ